MLPSQRMRHPLAPFLGPSFGGVFTLLMLLTVALSGILRATDGALRSDAAPYGMVSFEFALTLSAARTIVESWSPAAQVQAAFSLGLDFLYLVVYSSTLSLALLWAAIRSGSAAWLRWGDRLAWLPGIAALADAVENVALYQVLVGSFWPGWPPIAWACAELKFGLLAASTALIVTAMLSQNRAD
jgi:hypothetical protein